MISLCKNRAGGAGQGTTRAFSLVEMLVAMAVLLMLLGIMAAITNSVGKTVQWTTAKIDAFAGARSAFDLLSRRLSTATLNTYWDYEYPLKSGGEPDKSQGPKRYIRQSDLQFLVLQNTQNADYGQEIYFQAPESYATNAGVRVTRGLLNACSFFIQFGNHDAFRPGNVTQARWRYRLMQGIEPTEQLKVYETDRNLEIDTTPDWTAKIKNSGSGPVNEFVSPIADNVIALLIWPRLPKGEDANGAKLTSNYQYNSRSGVKDVPQALTANQMPPTVQVTMVTISEASAIRLDNGASTPPAKIENALSNKFTDPTKYEDDISDLSKALAAANIEFEVFNTSVTLRESKWSDPN